jgi:serine/threonine protein kinase
MPLIILRKMGSEWSWQKGSTWFVITIPFYFFPLQSNLCLSQWKGVIEGVAYLHNHNPIIIHGDLKPVSCEYTLDIQVTPIQGKYSG